MGSSDYFDLRDGIFEDSPLIGKFCGNGSKVPTFMQTTQNHLRIRWGRRNSEICITIDNSPLLICSSIDSSQTILRVVLDSIWNMNLLINSNGPLKWVLVVAISQLHMVSSPRHPIRTITQVFQIASIPSHRPMERSSNLNSWVWTPRHQHQAAAGIISRSEMEFQKIHLSSTKCVAKFPQLPSNQTRTKCGWSEDTNLSTTDNEALLLDYIHCFSFRSDSSTNWKGFQVEYSTIEA